MTIHINGIREARKVDEFTVDFVLEKPVPILLRNLVDFRIVSKTWAVKNKTEKAQDLKNKEETLRLAQCQRHRLLRHQVLAAGAARGDGAQHRPGGTRSPAMSTR